MAINLGAETITAGSAKLISATLTAPGTITGVTAILVNSVRAKETQAVITTALALAESSGVWSGVLTAAETAKLLADPADGSSALLYPGVYLQLLVTYDSGGNTYTKPLTSDLIVCDRNPTYSA